MGELQTISFLGSEGSNSHVLAQRVFPNAKMLPCPSFENVLAAVSEADADLGVIPVENTLAGRVADVHHLLPKSKLQIVGEHFMRIEHQLVTLPEAKISDIREVHSHVHALGQCREWLASRSLTGVAHSDTAGAAKMVRDRKDPTVAAISTRLAADLYDLKVAVTNIEDSELNFTRFLLLGSPNTAFPDLGRCVITTFLFEVRSVPSALYKALGGFATNGVNITKIESYMLPGRVNQTQFYIDIEGHPKERRVKLALEELRFFTEDTRVLGVYPASEFRDHYEKLR